MSSRTLLKGSLALLALSAIAGASASAKEQAFDFGSFRNCTKSNPAICHVVLGPSRPNSFLPQPLGSRLAPLFAKPQSPLAKGEERFVIPASAGSAAGGIELRVGRIVKTDCNKVQLAGVLQPVAGRESELYRFFRLQGKHAGDMMSTLMFCPKQELVERQVWLPGGHLSLASTGQATVVDLPSGWTLQWRARMVLPSNPAFNILPERWGAAEPLKASEPVEAHRD
ncbi:MAG: ecotin family protein [Vulcanococcus sp.]